MTHEEALRKVKGYLTDYFPPEDYDEVEEIMAALEQPWIPVSQSIEEMKNMKEIELVVKISEEQYEFIKQSMTMDKIKDYPALLYAICEHIKNGIQIPEGHGKLIDADKTIANAYEVYSSSGTPCIINAEQMYAIRKVLTAAPGIIGADKTEVELENEEEAEEELCR